MHIVRRFDYTASHAKLRTSDGVTSLRLCCSDPIQVSQPLGILKAPESMSDAHVDKRKPDPCIMAVEPTQYFSGRLGAE